MPVSCLRFCPLVDRTLGRSRPNDRQNVIAENAVRSTAIARGAIHIDRQISNIFQRNSLLNGNYSPSSDQRVIYAIAIRMARESVEEAERRNVCEFNRASALEAREANVGRKRLFIRCSLVGPPVRRRRPINGELREFWHTGANVFASIFAIIFGRMDTRYRHEEPATFIDEIKNNRQSLELIDSD